MRLIRFRVTNFKSVDDSDWVETDRVTALVGVNESGKTNLLLPLWKLNPARDGDIKPTSDYRKAIYTEIRANPDKFAFICAEFDTTDIADELSRATGRDAAHLNPVQVTRFFSGRQSISFPNCPSQLKPDVGEIQAKFAQAREDMVANPLPSKEMKFRAAILSGLEQAEAELNMHVAISGERLTSVAANIAKTLPHSQRINPSSDLIRCLIAELEVLAKTLDRPRPEEVKGLKELVLNSLPKFVYYSNYGNLDSEIYLPHVVENMQREDSLGAKEAAKARTLRVLFKFVDLPPKEILALGRDYNVPHQPTPSADEIARIADNKRE